MNNPDPEKIRAAVSRMSRPVLTPKALELISEKPSRKPSPGIHMDMPPTDASRRKYVARVALTAHGSACSGFYAKNFHNGN